MCREQNREAVRRFLEEAISTNNVDLIDELLSPHYVGHGYLWEVDRAAAMRGILSVFVAFPDVSVTIQDTVADGDTIVVRYMLEGTQYGAFAEVPASGIRIAVPGINWYRLQSGTIAEEWQGLDVLGILRQLGVIPSLESASA